MADGLRIVTFNALPLAYRLVADWAERHQHRLVLLVTSPGAPDDRYGVGLRDLLDVVPREQDVLVTTRPRRTAAPAIAALAPDLIVSVTFPHRIPPEVTAIPRYGAVNLHVTPLPRGRGTCPQRLIFEGDLTLGAAVHRIVPAFDAGPILCRHERRLEPAEVTVETIWKTWMDLAASTFDEGTGRAIAGEPGEPQDERFATHCTPFTDEERHLRWDEPALSVQRRAAALNLTGPTALGRLDGRTVLMSDVRARADSTPTSAPGTIVQRTGDLVTVCTVHGAITARVHSLPSDDEQR